MAETSRNGNYEALAELFFTGVCTVPVWQKYSICLSTWDFGLPAGWRTFLGYIQDTSA